MTAIGGAAIVSGICPFAVQRPTRNFGYPRGTHGQNQPWFIVSHVMAGYKRTLDDAGWREPAGVGVHFGIGRDGSISQYTNLFDAHWGNGVSGSISKYDRSNRHLAALEPMGQWISTGGGFALVADGVNLPNSHSISIEHEDEAKGGHIAWTPEMLDASIRVHRWCAEELARHGMPLAIDADALAGHFQIDAINRANCPGSAWPKAAILAALQADEPQEEEEKEMPYTIYSYGFVDVPLAPESNPSGNVPLRSLLNLPPNAGDWQLEFLCDQGFVDIYHGLPDAANRRAGQVRGQASLRVRLGAVAGDCYLIPGGGATSIRVIPQGFYGS